MTRNLLFVPLLLTACATASKDGDTASNFGSLDDQEAVALWEDIQSFESWSQYEGWEGIVASESVHGDFVQIWLNDLALEALVNNQTVPDGGILVKQTFNDADGTDLKDITVMKKIEGYNLEAGDWFWGQYLEDGTVQTSGSPSMCTGCHASGNDYIRFVGE